ncbi:hypothetical protein [Burkholderia metallica]|nr:hypothetical protein [Burkholderia metallica]VWB27568.1 hypothetical protein BME24068_01142 [Burkholderia metallica]
MQSTIEQAAGLVGASRAVRQGRKNGYANDASGRAGARPSHAVGKESAHA